MLRHPISMATSKTKKLQQRKHPMAMLINKTRMMNMRNMRSNLNAASREEQRDKLSTFN